MTQREPWRRKPAGPVAVKVEREGEWYPGELHEWSNLGEGWRALVSYSVAPGYQHLHYVPAHRVMKYPQTATTETSQ